VHGITALREASHGKNQIAHVAVKHHMGREIIFEELKTYVIMIPKRHGRTDDMQSHNCALRSIAP